jgi:antitoxin MazE
MQISKWGNSLAIRIPSSVVKALELHEGDDIEVLVAGEREFHLKKKPDRQALLARLRHFRGKLPADFKFEREDANDRG